MFDTIISDVNAGSRVFHVFCKGISKLDESSLSSLMKVLALNYVLCKQMKWDFMIYKI